jgi:hypothetical protein
LVPVLILASAFVVLAFPGVAGADPAPAWQILQEARPTSFVPGSEAEGKSASPGYELFVTNVGGEAATGTVVTDTLPAGVSVAESCSPVPNSSNYSCPGLEFPAESGKSAPFFTEQLSTRGTAIKKPCEVEAETRTITCMVLHQVDAGAVFRVQIPVIVSSSLSAPSTITNAVTVASAGASTSNAIETTVELNSSPFGILSGPGLLFSAFDERGDTPSAGSHPFVTTINIGVPGVQRKPGASWVPVQAMRSVSLGLPQGFVINPQATTVRCSQLTLAHQASTEPAVLCPQQSQVGVAYPVISGALQHAPTPIYNVVPPPGVPAALAFTIEGAAVEVLGGVSSGFHLTGSSTEIISKFSVGEIALSLWGVPSDPRHNAWRVGGELTAPDECIETGGCGIEPSPAPFITMPTSCTEPTAVTASVESWLGGFAEALRPLSDRNGAAAALSGCGELAFEPTITSNATTTAAESPSGLTFSIHQPQEESLEGRSTAALKDATVALPEGMTLNAGAANGLGSCTEAQMGYAPEEGKVRFSTEPQSCPNSAKVGTLKVRTPLLGHELPGSIYLAKPYDNPFGSLVAIYLAIEDEESGIVAKLAGKVDPNPVTGQLTATFSENPELPVSDIDLSFFEGARGALTTPLTCGTKTTTSTLVPWSTPEGQSVHPTGSFETSAGCTASESAAPKTMSFTAGTVSPLSGSYSPFVLRLSRPDGSQHITGLETTLPEGLLGKLAGITYCPESGIEQAISREQPEHELGKLEQTSPSCPASSQVGNVSVTAGSGTNPLRVSGHAYLAGPYKGAPLSLVVIVPAVAGPFDLGTVVDRVALDVGEYDARIRAVADPLPTIRDGIPLDVRSIELTFDRPSFTLNPTSCEVMAIEGVATTQAGQTAALNNRFQVGECGRLKFSPKLSLSLSGATGRTGHPALKATVTFPKKGVYANIARAQVALPHAEFLNQSAIAGACTKPLLAAHACPKKSIYGRAEAWSPLLEKPLEGPVYLVGGYGYKLPAMVAELNGQIRLLLVGKVDTGKSGGIRNTFETVPDAPVSKFVLKLHSGKKGLLENSEDICEKPRKAGVAFTAQNGKVKKFAVKIGNSCGKGKNKKRHSK